MKKITPSLIATHDPAEYEWTGENPIPVCYCYGMGVDSTAMLEGMAKHGIEVNIPGEPSFRCYRPDLITFADTGSEKRQTYLYVQHADGYPFAQIVFRPCFCRKNLIFLRCHTLCGIATRVVAPRRCREAITRRSQLASVW